MKKCLGLLLAVLMTLSQFGFAKSTDSPIDSQTTIVGGGIIGALESYYAYQEAEKNGKKIAITVYEKGQSFAVSSDGKSSTNTSYNLVPSLTIDEILSVVPRGSELVEKLAVLFSTPGGIRVDDVVGVNDSLPAIQFQQAVTLYGRDKSHDDRTLSLLTLGKKSMELWQQMYEEGDDELKEILKASNFNPCREPTNTSTTMLRDGYRIDLIYGVANAENKALSMKQDYERLGYKNCKILSPSEVLEIDPYLKDFCKNHSELTPDGAQVWRKDSIALWRPGGCIDTNSFLPKFYAYLKKKMGQYPDAQGQMQDCFQLHFSSEVTKVEFASDSENLHISGLELSNGKKMISGADHEYIFCPGEAVGTLHRLGFQEPAYAAFAGASLLLNIPLSDEQVKMYQNFSHCMEVHNEGIVLAWQARCKEKELFIGVAGTKAFYGDKQPDKNEEFAKNRNLVQLNMINDVLPEYISLACGYNTEGKILSQEDLDFLEEKGIAKRWAGRRAVAYDGFPTLGALYSGSQKVSNARCTTHLGSGGVSFGPGSVFLSRMAKESSENPFVQKILQYASSSRVSK